MDSGFEVCVRTLPAIQVATRPKKERRRFYVSHCMILFHPILVTLLRPWIRRHTMIKLYLLCGADWSHRRFLVKG